MISPILVIPTPPHEETWNYKSVMGKINFLERSKRPDLAYSAHQCSRFMADPKKQHTEAVKHIGRYLFGTADKGIIATPNKDYFVFWVDSDFAGNWKSITLDYSSNYERSRTGYVITYANCQVYWSSNIQHEITLS